MIRRKCVSFHDPSQVLANESGIKANGFSIQAGTPDQQSFGPEAARMFCLPTTKEIHDLSGELYHPVGFLCRGIHSLARKWIQQSQDNDSNSRETS